MQHFGVKSKVVRHAGAWAKQQDSMPDLYLRESQLMVLSAQENCLAQIRAGRTVTSSRGDPIERSCSRMLWESRNWGVSSQPNSGWR